MALPKKLKYFNVYIDGNSYIGQAESITLPKLTQKMEGYRGAGLIGSVNVNLGLDDDALDMEITMGGFMENLMAMIGGSINSVNLRFAGAYQVEDTEEFTKVEIEVSGRFKDVDPGEQKQGESTSEKYTMTNTYYKLTVDGEDKIEVDIINMVYKRSGNDMLETARQAIGL